MHAQVYAPPDGLIATVFSWGQWVFQGAVGPSKSVCPLFVNKTRAAHDTTTGCQLTATAIEDK